MVYEHLRQIPNTPFYVTPDEPADPRDCARYPDSPYCGGNPFSFRPVAINPQIVNNECATGIKITPVLGFVKLPPIEILHIKPKCQPKRPPPSSGGPVAPWTPKGSKAIRSGIYIYAQMFFSLNGEVQIVGNNIITDFMNPMLQQYIASGEPLYTPYFEAFAEDWMNYNIRPYYSGSEIEGHYIYFLENKGEPIDSPSPPPAQVPSPPPPPPKRKCNCMGCCPPSPTQDKNDRDLEEIKRLLKLLLKKVGEPQSVVLFDEDPNKPGRQKKTVKKETLFDAVKLATQRAEVANQILGIEAFPIDVPATVINPEKSGIWGKVFGFIDGKKRRKLKSVAEFIAWQSEQDAAVLGKWHQTIPIADSDATKKGDQPEKVVLPNVAETLKEIILLVANLIQSQGMMMDVTLKTLTETSAVKVEVAKTQLVVRDMQQYFDYDTQDEVFEVPIQIGVPPADATDEDMANFSKFLEPSMTKVASPEWMGRDSFQEALTDLRAAAAMIRATFSNRT